MIPKGRECPGIGVGTLISITRGIFIPIANDAVRSSDNRLPIRVGPSLRKVSEFVLNASGKEKRKTHGIDMVLMRIAALSWPR